MIRNLIALLLAVFALNAFAVSAATAASAVPAAVDVNQASRADLETVKGIGPGLSGKIIEARKTGDFKDWNDLVDRVGGIGPGNAAKLSQGGLTVRGASYSAQAPAAKDKATRVAKADKADKADKSTKKATKAAPAQL